MITRALDINGDWQFGQSRQSYKRGLEAIKQSLLTRLRSWRGDCFFASLEGVDWNNYLDIGTKRLLDIDICRVVNQTGGIVRVVQYESQITADRTFALKIKVNTIYGNIDISEEIG